MTATATSNVFDEIQSAITTYVPTIESILAVGVSLFDPALGPIVQGGLTIANAIIADLEALSADFAKTTAAQAPGQNSTAWAPRHVGATKRGVVVTGYRKAA